MALAECTVSMQTSLYLLKCNIKGQKYLFQVWRLRQQQKWEQYLTAQFASMQPDLSLMAFVSDHWTDKYRQIEFTSIAVSFVVKVYDLCIRGYDAATKHAPSIHDDLIRQLETYWSSRVDADRWREVCFCVRQWPQVGSTTEGRFR